MAEIVEVSGPDLAAMLCSRVCHDLISPVGAIGNGLEVLADPEQAEMADFAQELINNSARQARAKLEFARLAFGASSTQGTEIDTREAEKVSQSFHGGRKGRVEVEHRACFVAEKQSENAAQLAVDLRWICATWWRSQCVVGWR